MATRFITIQDVRETSGVAQSEVDDNAMTTIIEDVENSLEEELNTTFTPKTEIEILNSKNLWNPNIKVKKTPLLAVKQIENEDDSIALANVKFNRSGIIKLTDDADRSYWDQEFRTVKIKYLYGRLKHGSQDATTETNAAATAGTSVALSVDDESDFATDDWVEITGFDGNQEVAQVTSTSSGQITVDELFLDHESGSRVQEITISNKIKKLLKVLAGIGAVSNVVGSSFDEITGYDLSELRVQKGEPYTQWRETVRQLIQERDRLLKKVKPQFAITS